MTGEAVHPALAEAVQSGSVEAVRRALEQNVGNINGLDQRGHTALHWAVFGGYVEIVQLLLTRGADPNVASRDGITPLWNARDFGLAEIDALLVKHGAKV